MCIRDSLAILGVVVETSTSPATTLDASNPAADAFLQGAGQIGYRFFGLVLLCAAVTSIIGCAYTSVSFLKTFSKTIANNEKWFIVGFIALSTVVMALIGTPATLLVLAGALNGLILPITLGVCLIASQKKSITVSYTHLDVYKRQSVFCDHISNKFFTCHVVRNITFIYRSFTSILLNFCL